MADKPVKAEKSGIKVIRKYSGEKSPEQVIVELIKAHSGK